MGSIRGRGTYHAWNHRTFCRGAVWMVVILLSVTALPAGATVTVDTGPLGPPPSPAAPGLGAGTSLAFNLTNGPGIVALQGTNPTLAAQVIAGFAAAGNLWSTHFSDDITINVTVDYAPLGAGILGSTGNETAQANFLPTKDALIAEPPALTTR